MPCSGGTIDGDGDWNEDILLVVKMEKSLGHVHQL